MPEDTPEGGTTTSTTEKTLTQEQVNKVVEERLARERQKFSDYDDLKEKAAKFDELDDKSKTEVERLTSKLSDAERRAEDAEKRAMRLEVALDKGLTKTQAKRLVGDTADELVADADDLLESFRPADNGTSSEEERKPDTSRRPVEKLTPGATPGTEPEPDPKEIADSILSESAI